MTHFNPRSSPPILILILDEINDPPDKCTKCGETIRVDDGWVFNNMTLCGICAHQADPEFVEEATKTLLHIPTVCPSCHKVANEPLQPLTVWTADAPDVQDVFAPSIEEVLTMYHCPACLLTFSIHGDKP